MRIEFERSGGIAGMVLRATVDSSDLPAHQALLEQLLAGGSPPVTARPSGADRFVYDVRLSDGSRSRQLHWGEAEVPASVQPLIADLSQRARP